MGERKETLIAISRETASTCYSVGAVTFWRDMKHDWVKIPNMAKELGVSVKTIYNWIGVGKLFMPRPGYVSQIEAYEVWLQQKQLKTFKSYFQSQDLIRDSFGRFSGKDSTNDPA